MARFVFLSPSAVHRTGRAPRVALALALLSAAGPSVAQTATGTATAVIVEPLGLVKVEDLRFGRIAASNTAGTITVNADTGACTASGGVRSAGGCGFGQFSGQGARRLTVRIQIPSSVSLAGPAGATMVADTITLGASPDLAFLGSNGNGNGNSLGTAPRYQINSNSGLFTFRLGGRLNVAAGQKSGQYSGTFPITVQYQ